MACRSEKRGTAAAKIHFRQLRPIGKGTTYASEDREVEMTQFYDVYPVEPSTND